MDSYSTGELYNHISAYGMLEAIIIFVLLDLVEMLYTPLTVAPVLQMYQAIILSESQFDNSHY